MSLLHPIDCSDHPPQAVEAFGEHSTLPVQLREDVRIRIVQHRLHIGQGQSAEPKVQRLLRAQRVNRVGLDGQYASNAASLREAGALQVA